ncbi:hypothetical protein LTR09_002029 [Extremus antarcticus]|uniref:Copper acquisition factor BIM1-like domain-containing protein n=1 Tax=Extremus antarcticus TaxID=702011 RepID=A0AAJ0GGA4_9PEZI|nr:hypothetical protein LTR09_002029 [Extremus antarcticus]
MQLLNLLALATVATAHFELFWPPSAGFNEDKEPTSPCGGFEVDLSIPQPIHVDRFQASLLVAHPVSKFSFRGTNSTSAPYSFTDLVPVIDTKGPASFCLEYLSAPAEWAGSTGVLQVVDDSPDGILYQCAAVSWVAGANDTIGSSCSNSSSSFSATWTSQESFAATAAGTSASSTGAAAMATGMAGILGAGFMVVAGLAL